MRRISFRLLAVAALALSGCAPSPAPGGQPSGSPTPSATGMLVDFRRSGGFVGASDHLVVQQDGGYSLQRTHPAVTKTGRLSEADLADLRKLLTETDFAHMPRVQPAKGADLFMYQVIYGDVQITATDGGLVEPLKPVVSTLSGLVGRYS